MDMEQLQPLEEDVPQLRWGQGSASMMVFEGRQSRALKAKPRLWSCARESSTISVEPNTYTLMSCKLNEVGNGIS